MDAPTLSLHHLLGGGLDRIAALGSIVTVWAHPDDETYIAGGAMAAARYLGQPVTCVTLTDGDFAPTEPERRRAAATRAVELERALDILGVEDLVRFGWRDGECALIDDAAGVAAIADVLAARRPDTIITFGPDGLTGHPDHRAVARWPNGAARLAAPEALVLCPTMTPQMWLADRDINECFDVYEAAAPTLHDDAELFADLEITGHWLDVKLAALQAHDSQTSGLIDALGIERYRRWISREPLIERSRW